MEVKQIATLLNTVSDEVLGRDENDNIKYMVTEDLTNIVDMGTAIFDSNSADKYVAALVDHIGRVIFVNRVYRGVAPSVVRDAWEYGAVLQKITVDTLPVAINNDDWGLVSGQSYDPFVFNPPAVSNKFYNKYVTFEIDLSYLRKQIRSAFDSPEQINAFLSMIFNSVEKSFTVKMDALVMRTINNMIAQVIMRDVIERVVAGGGTAPSADTPNYIESPDFHNITGFTPQVINLLTLYNATLETPITSAQAIHDTGFLKFAAYTIGAYSDRMRMLNNMLNCGHKDRFTDGENLKIVMLSDFARAANVYLQSDTFHNEFTRFPVADLVPFWQAPNIEGDPAIATYDISAVSTIDTTVEYEGHKIGVSTSYILAAMFDRDALGVANLERETDSIYNPKGSFYNNFYKFRAGYFNDLNEQFVVFIAE